MIWHALHPNAEDLVGFLPTFLSDADKRTAREQLDANYQHGGGWRPNPKWSFNPKTAVISYPGDPPLKPVAFTMLRDEMILVYPSSFVAVVQPDDSFEIARMD